VIYHVYPRSFSDSNGVGDLAGTAQKLFPTSRDSGWTRPYSTFYPSPEKDFGYDVSDHTDVDPLSGTLPDFGGMIEEAQRSIAGRSTVFGTLLLRRSTR
jgi:alpha-glucosidase